MDQGQNQDRGIRVIDGFRFTIGAFLAVLLIAVVIFLVRLLFTVFFGIGMVGIAGSVG